MNKNLVAAFACLAIIAIITLISGSNIGFRVSEKPVESISRAELAMTSKESVVHRVPVYTITVSNTFVPRGYAPEFSGCFYNSVSGDAEWASITANAERESGPFSQLGSVELGIGETKDIRLFVDSGLFFEPVPSMGTNRIFDSLFLFKKQQQDCWDLSSEDLEKAIRIPIV